MTSKAVSRARARRTRVEQVHLDAILEATRRCAGPRGPGSWVTRGEVFTAYQNAGLPAPVVPVGERHFLNGLHALERERRIECKLVSYGRGGRYNMIRLRGAA